MAATQATAVHFNEARFERFIAEHGTPATWRKARQCPCLDEVTGQADPNCALCMTYPGIVWDAQGIALNILAPGRSRRDFYDSLGAAERGIIQLTFPAVLPGSALPLVPGHEDWVQFEAAQLTVNNERLIRGAVDPLGRSVERVRMPTVLNVDACESVTGRGVTAHLVEYVWNVDFTIDVTGAVTWSGSNVPASGQAYVLRYQARPVYICWGPQSRDEYGVQQPYKCFAQRLDFFRRPAAGDGT